MYSAEANAFQFREIFRQGLEPGVTTGSLLAPLEETLREVPPTDIEPKQKILWAADHLHRVGDGLATAGLPGGFNLTYASLTDTIGENFSAYDSPDALGEAVIRFEGHYIDPALAMVEFMDGDDSALARMRRVWVLAMLHRKLLEPGVPDVIQTGIGIDAHVVVDLTPTLVVSNPPEEYKKDYMTVVAEHIAETIKQLAPQLIPGHRSLQTMVVPLINKMIHVGRVNAWNDYEKAKLLTPQDQERLYVRRDRQAELLGRIYLTAGRSALALAQATEQFSFDHRSDAPVDDDRAA